MKIIIINGYAGVGKSTFVEMCEDYGQILEVSTIDSVKELAEVIGWKGQKEPKDRKFLSDFKDLLTRYNDYPFNATISIIKEKLHLEELEGQNIDDQIIFIHCREPEEIERFKNALGARSLIVRRHGPETITQINHADNGVFDAVYDYMIFNDGDLDRLKESAQTFIEQIQKEDWESYL